MAVSKSRRQKAKPKQKATPVTHTVQVVRRRFEYEPSQRKDNERLVSLLAEIGTHWEPILFPITWRNADAKDREFIRQFVEFFRPDHPCADVPESEKEAVLATVTHPHIAHIKTFIEKFRAQNPDHWK